MGVSIFANPLLSATASRVQLAAMLAQFRRCTLTLFRRQSSAYSTVDKPATLTFGQSGQPLPGGVGQHDIDTM